VKLWIAQGFGVGRIPVAPGTFGSVVGIGWFALLLLPGNFWVFVVGSLASLPVSVWLCGEAEKTLKQQDPGSVVLDEIVAIPVCFAGWIAYVTWQTGRMPGCAYFFSSWNILAVAGVYAAFRVFDIGKPWPVAQSQALPGGWGVTVDDVLAAVYVNLVVWVVYLVKTALFRHTLPAG
jgi:phosphatidylglycerophosphatase A